MLGHVDTIDERTVIALWFIQLTGQRDSAFHAFGEENC